MTAAGANGFLRVQRPHEPGLAPELHRLRGHRLRDAPRGLHERPGPVRQPLEVRAALGRRERPDELVRRRGRNRPRSERQRRGDRRRRGHGLRARDGRPAVGRAGVTRLAVRAVCRPASEGHLEGRDTGRQAATTRRVGRLEHGERLVLRARVLPRVRGDRPGRRLADRRRHRLRHAGVRGDRGERQRDQRSRTGLVRRQPRVAVQARRGEHPQRHRLPVRLVPYAISHRPRLVLERRAPRAGVSRAHERVLQRRRRGEHRRHVRNRRGADARSTPAATPPRSSVRQAWAR